MAFLPSTIALLLRTFSISKTEVPSPRPPSPSLGFVKVPNSTMDACVKSPTSVGPRSSEQNGQPTLAPPVPVQLATPPIRAKTNNNLRCAMANPRLQEGRCKGRINFRILCPKRPRKEIRNTNVEIRTRGKETGVSQGTRSQTGVWERGAIRNPSFGLF